MRREVAGVLGYFKNIPEKVGETTVKSVRVYASSSNTAYNIPHFRCRTSVVLPVLKELQF